MKRNFIFCVILGLIFIGALGCDKIKIPVSKKTEVAEVKAVPVIPQVKGVVIAKVNNIPIGLDDFNQEVEIYNANVPEDRPELKITTREQKINYLKNEVVRRTLLYQNALDKGLDRNEDVLMALDKTKMQLLVMELIKQVSQKVDVSSKEIEDYYNTYKEQLKEPEERQIREIVSSSEQEARDILIQLLQGADFATLARTNSKSSSAKDGGDLGFVKLGVKSSQFNSVAFSDSLEAGKISSIFKTPDGYSIIKLEGKRGGKQKPLSEMWDDIKTGLVYLKRQQVIDELIGKLSRDAKIDIYEGEIK
ncbi:MAG: peptidylprolyl isomerase [Candidatus Omnitrophica bacterium]|nr:peptidylprolyl isomerase [Candidatus Omnitrophota bacterium]MBU1922833.1 peptidylprolyl isomerase [Candidatus Omnitrophota bacterium]